MPEKMRAEQVSRRENIHINPGTKAVRTGALAEGWGGGARGEEGKGGGRVSKVRRASHELTGLEKEGTVASELGSGMGRDHDGDRNDEHGEEKSSERSRWW